MVRDPNPWNKFPRNMIRAGGWWLAIVALALIFHDADGVFSKPVFGFAYLGWIIPLWHLFDHLREKHED